MESLDDLPQSPRLWRTDRLQERGNVRLDRTELWGCQRQSVPLLESVGRIVALYRCIAAIEDAGDSDYPDDAYSKVPIRRALLRRALAGHA